MQMESLPILNRDLKSAATTLSDLEARYLVDMYYTMQGHRIAINNQVKAASKGGEPHDTLSFFLEQSKRIENQIKSALDTYSVSSELGQWARKVVGIGPVIAAGLLAHIDFEKATTAGKIWRYAGLDPTCEWKKGEKRPWNASLKVLCWKIGESFVKVCNHNDDFYGKFYVQRKELEEVMNEEGKFADQAELILKKIPNHKQASTYKLGKLPAGHLHSRAKRFAVKMFLAHYHEVGFRLFYNAEPPVPYVIQHMGHVDRIYPPFQN